MPNFNQGPQATMAMETQSPLVSVGAALQNFAGRIGSGLRTGYEAIRDMPRSLKTYAAVGATAVTLFTLANAETANADTNSVAPEGNVPGLTGVTPLSGNPEAIASTATTTTSDSALEQECRTAGLKPPATKGQTPFGRAYAFMSNPGKNPGQGMNINLVYDAMPDDCHGIYRRNGQYQIRLQMAKHHNQWVRLQGWSYGNEAYTSDEVGGFIKNGLITNDHNPPKFFYQCTPGQGKTEVQLELKNSVKDLQTGQIIGRKIVKEPMKVYGAC